MSFSPHGEPKLREGFTTGSAAAAASLAALHCLCTGEILTEVSVPLPPAAESTHRLHVPVASVTIQEAHTALGSVIKDGGDDPDATHGAVIEALVRFTPADAIHGVHIRIDGGEGVGRVTLPGLPVAVGEAAINPGPKAQIEQALREVCAQHQCYGHVHCLVRVPDGERRARHTFNPRLGILGGISILGTQGTVRPFSHRAWQQTIIQGLDVARATGSTQSGLSSGRRSERLLMAQYPQWTKQSFIQAADFIGFAVQEAAQKAFTHLAWGGFFGKLVKLAQGHLYTHANATRIDMPTLAAVCAAHALDGARAESIHCANTAAQALEIILDDPAANDILYALARQAHAVLRTAIPAAAKPHLTIHLFHLDGRELVRV